jgi:carboxymethylenebutenolidase
MQLTFDSNTEAELLTPSDGREPTRGLVMLPDIGGLRPLFVERAQQIADEHGWAVCVFEPYWIFEGLILADRLNNVGNLIDEDILNDCVTAADACDADHVGVMGFCLGGMYAYKAAAIGRFDRAVSFYGMVRLAEDWDGPFQAEPLESLVKPGRCPTLAIIGTDDVWIPAEDVTALEATGVEVVRYQGAEHGFVHDPTRPAHRVDDAADAWARAFAFLSG